MIAIVSNNIYLPTYLLIGDAIAYKNNTKVYLPYNNILFLCFSCGNVNILVYNKTTRDTKESALYVACQLL